MAAVDLTGSRFGALTVVSRVENDASGSAVWRCACDCGQLRSVAGTGLRAGRNKSCGCLSPRFKSGGALIYCESDPRTRAIWRGMWTRCNDARSKKAHLYALKGVKVCDRWAALANFIADMGPAPAGLSIDRIDGAMGYEPGNCKWATPKEQANNTTRNRIVEHSGKRLTVSQWAEQLGIKPNTLVYRLRRGWPTDRALEHDAHKEASP